MAKFKTGDLVVLKSGSPAMTVDSVGGGRVRAVWFAGAKQEGALDLAPPKVDKK